MSYLQDKRESREGEKRKTRPWRVINDFMNDVINDTSCECPWYLEECNYNSDPEMPCDMLGFWKTFI